MSYICFYFGQDPVGHVVLLLDRIHVALAKRLKLDEVPALIAHKLTHRHRIHRLGHRVEEIRKLSDDRAVRRVFFYVRIQSVERC